MAIKNIQLKNSAGDTLKVDSAINADNATNAVTANNAVTFRGRPGLINWALFATANATHNLIYLFQFTVSYGLFYLRFTVDDRGNGGVYEHSEYVILSETTSDLDLVRIPEVICLRNENRKKSENSNDYFNPSLYEKVFVQQCGIKKGNDGHIRYNYKVFYDTSYNGSQTKYNIITYSGPWSDFTEDEGKNYVLNSSVPNYGLDISNIGTYLTLQNNTNFDNSFVTDLKGSSLQTSLQSQIISIKNSRYDIESEPDDFGNIEMGEENIYFYTLRYKTSEANSTCTVIVGNSQVNGLYNVNSLTLPSSHAKRYIEVPSNVNLTGGTVNCSSIITASGPIRISTYRSTIGDKLLVCGTSSFYNSQNNLQLRLGSDFSLFNNQVVFNDTAFFYNGAVETSDIRFKNNIKNLPSLLPEIEDLNTFTYTWQDQLNLILGVSAQQLQEKPTLGLLVATNTEDTLSVNYAKLSVVALKCIQEQQLQIEELKQEVKELKEKLS